MKSNMSAGPEILWAGIDLAKLTFQVAIWGHLLFQEMQCRSFDRTRKAMKVFLVWLRAQAPVGAKMGLVMEATGTFAEEMASWLLDLDPTLWVAIVNPGQTSAFIKSLGFRNKTDDLDAKGLGKYGQERRPAPWERPTPEMAALKDLVRIRMDLISARTAMHLRLKDHKRASKKASDAMRKVILSLKVQIQQLEKGDHGPSRGLSDPGPPVEAVHLDLWGRPGHRDDGYGRVGETCDGSRGVAN